MKTVSVNISSFVYEGLKEFADARETTVEEVIFYLYDEQLKELSKTWEATKEL